MTNKLMSAFIIAMAISIWVPTLAQAHDPINDWNGVGYTFSFRPGKVTPEMVKDRRNISLPYCLKEGLEVVPEKTRTILLHGALSGTAGGLGASTGAKAYGALTGLKVIGTLPSFVLNFLGNVFFGAVQGDQVTNDRYRSAVTTCLSSIASGYYPMGPNEQDEVIDTNTPHIVDAVGRSRPWHLADDYGPDGKLKSSAATTAATPVDTSLMTQK